MRVFQIACLALLLIIGETSYARFAWVDDVIRGTGKVSGEIAIKNADDTAEYIARTGLARESIEHRLKRMGKLTGELDDAARKTLRNTEVRHLLDAAGTGINPQTAKQLRNLDDAMQETAVVFAQGGKSLAETVPDLALRGRLLKSGGADVVAAAGLYGDDAAKAAFRLDAVLNAGKVVIPQGAKRAITLEDFGRVMVRGGQKTWKFWQTYVQPHWKLWLSSGALTAFLLEPEYFTDALGNLTAHGFEKLTELMGTVAAEAVRGIGEGGGKAVEHVRKAFYETYIGSPNAVNTIIGTLILLLILGFMFKGTRTLLLMPFRRNKAHTKGEM